MSSDTPSPDRPIDGLEQSAEGARESRVAVFAIFDAEHDGDLYGLLQAQSNRPGYGFRLTGGSEASSDSEAGRRRVRRQIREADQVIVICGENTDASPRAHAEFLIARDEQKPYFLLWGRRGVMCTKPIGAKPSDGMYSWTRQFLHDQISFNRRKRDADAEAKSLRKVNPTAKTPP